MFIQCVIPLLFILTSPGADLHVLPEMLEDRQTNKLRLNIDIVTEVEGMCKALLTALLCDLTSPVKVCMKGTSGYRHPGINSVYKLCRLRDS